MAKPNQLASLFSYLRLHANDLVRVALILIAVLLMTWMLPKKLYNQFDYDINKPWVYRDLIAPFDFPVFKTAEVLAEDADKVLAEHAPYYRSDDTVEPGVLQELSRFTANYADSTALFARLSVAVAEIYRSGLAAPADIDMGDIIYVLNKESRVVKQESSQLFNLNGAVNLLREAWGQQADIKALSDFAEEYLAYNLRYDENLTQKIKDQLLSEISETLGMVQEGELIVGKGALVTAEVFRKIRSLEKANGAGEVTDSQIWLATGGQFMIVVLIILILVFYLYFFRKELFYDNRRFLVLLLNVVGIVALYSFSARQGISSIYLIPFCILPIITRALFDAWVAMMTLVVAALICSFYSGYASEFLVLQLTAGMSAVFSLISIRRRSQFYITAGLIFVVYALGYTAYTLISKGDYTELIPLYYGYFGVNALLTLIASPLLFGYEKLFGFVSDVTLMELSDTNSPLLRELNMQAPGTFQHSLQVSNLAEAAIYDIGGNPLLVRVGALYHDIGKMNNPMYFIENQAGLNPHDDLPFEDSAQIIVGHVLDGIDMAKKHRLPNVIIDFIRTHHGDQRVEYFYQSFLKNYPHQAVDETKFRYPGPKPFSKETAVLMMADSVEAASRSLKEHTEESIGELVDAIIDKQITNNQFINANITLRDIQRIKQLYKKKLGSIYHVRIAYPKS